MQGQMRAVVVMGVSGCGKSSVAAALSDRIGAHMIEGDAYHPERNVQKMKAGIALGDADRQGWLERLATELANVVATGGIPVLACSALKRRYRDTLRAGVADLGFVFLEVSPDVVSERVSLRPHHFMPATLVQSQFRDLESPTGEARVLTIDGSEPLHLIVDQAQHWWNTGNEPTRIDR